MVGNWRERKESGVGTKEGAIKVSVLKAVLFLWRGLKPPDNTILFKSNVIYNSQFHELECVHHSNVHWMSRIWE